MMNSPQNKVVLAAFLGILSGCQTVPHTQAKQQAEQRWNEVRARVKFQLAKQQYEGALFKEASDSLAESMALDPRRVESYVLLARAQLEQGKPASAEQTVSAARQRGLDSAELHYTRGVILEQRDQLDEALEEYARAHEMNPGDADALAARAECLVSLGRQDEAAALLDENLHRFDEAATVTVLAARVAELRGQAPRAVELLERAVVDAPDEPSLSDELVLHTARAGRCDQVLARWDARPGTDDPPSGALSRAVGQCFLRSSQPMRASEVLSTYLARQPGDDRAQLLLAQASLETNDLWGAAAALQVARSRRPESPEVLLTEAALRWRQNELSAAADLLYSLLERHPAQIDAYVVLAEVLAAQNQPDAAADCRNRATRLRTDCYNPVTADLPPGPAQP